MRFAVAAAAGSLPAGAEPPSTQRSQPSNGCQAGREQRDDAWHGWHHTAPHRTGQAGRPTSKQSAASVTSAGKIYVRRLDQQRNLDLVHDGAGSMTTPCSDKAPAWGRRGGESSFAWIGLTSKENTSQNQMTAWKQRPPALCTKYAPAPHIVRTSCRIILGRRRDESRAAGKTMSRWSVERRRRRHASSSCSWSWPQARGHPKLWGFRSAF